ncbi:MAG: DinB family protein [Gemmatimonadaceae bacterium]
MSEPEVWLRGPVPGIPPYLQPVAHSLLQCRAEVRATLDGAAREMIWRRPGNVASIGYHVRHAIGSLGRLLTYARGEQLSPAQMAELRTEGDEAAGPSSATELVSAFDDAVEVAFVQLRATNEATLLDAREVGRAKLPSTVIGLLFHAAEHTQRHVGQLVTTARQAMHE